MPNFRYKAVGASGRIEIGAIESFDRISAISELQAKGLLPIEAIEAPLAAPSRFAFKIPRRTNVPPRELGLVLQELAVLLQAGLALDRALDLLVNEQASKRLKPAMAGILENVQRGATLADATGAYPALFPSSVTTLIEAGEAGGTLPLSLIRAADMLLRGAALRETIVSALLYPMILLCVAGLSLTIIMTVVIPEFKPLFEDAGASLPVPTRIVMAIGDLVGAYWLPVLLLLIVGGVFAHRAWQRPSVRLSVDQRILKLPFLGKMIAKIEVARFARTLGTLVENGIALPVALGITHRGFGNTALAQAINKVGASLKEGEGLATPLEATKLFPRTALHLIRVGEETARLGDMLERLADILEREVQRNVQRTLALMVPLVTVGLGVLIAGIIASILVAVLSLNDLAILK
jgi:general secretion pathway protein F